MIALTWRAMSATYDDFRKIDIRVGTVREAAPFDEARRPALRLRIDFGPEIGTLRSSAQLTALYESEALVGRQVAAVVNFPPKQIGKHMSECLVLGFPDPNGEPVLIQPERAVPDGGRLW